MSVFEQVVTGKIAVIEQPGATVARLSGHVDAAVREQAGVALVGALNRDVPLVLDLTRVRSMDADGIAFVVQCCTIGAEEGLRVTLRGAPPVVTEVLTLLRDDDTLQSTCAEPHRTPSNID